MAVSIPVLQKWWWSVPHTIFDNDDRCRHSPFSSRTRHRTILSKIPNHAFQTFDAAVQGLGLQHVHSQCTRRNLLQHDRCMVN
jgi:hypothetical protein